MNVFCWNCVGVLVFWGLKSLFFFGSVLKWSEKIREVNLKDVNIFMVFIVENIFILKWGKLVDWIGYGKMIESKVLLDDFCVRYGFVGWF